MIIGLGHVKRQGKDTFAKFLQEEIPDSVILSFADPLYKVCHELFEYAGMGTRAFYLENQHLKDTPLSIGISPRQILLFVGEKMRELYSDIWVDLLIQESTKYDFVIVPDVRHHNEVAAIQKVHGMLLKITRPGDVVMHPGDIDMNLNDFHGWDESISNDGSLTDLKMKAKLFVEDLIS